jgi:hypothetical protein
MIVSDLELERDPAGSWTERHARVTTILLLGRLSSARGDALCRIRNVSCGGLMAEARGRFTAGEAVEVELKAGDRIPGTIRWTVPGRVGIAFAETVEVGRFLAHASGRCVRAGEVRSQRFETDCLAGLSGKWRAHSMRLVNLSQGGARLAGAADLAKGELLRLAIPRLPERRAAVRWMRDGIIGLAFLEAFSFGELSTWLAEDEWRFATRTARGPAA